MCVFCQNADGSNISFRHIETVFFIKLKNGTKYNEIVLDIEGSRSIMKAKKQLNHWFKN